VGYSCGCLQSEAKTIASKEVVMRYRIPGLTAAALISLAVTGCARSFDVHTMAAPKLTLTEFRSFHLLPTPRRRDGLPGAGAYDPMVNNSITNRALRASVADAFYNRGYVDEEWMPDFVVAVYASAREKLDISVWQYGYPYTPRWNMGGMPQPALTQYNEGTVVVDVIDPRTSDLLWRGSATAVLGDDSAENTKLLRNAAVAIVEKFPQAKSGPVVAGR
jgi:hypothetical protein